MDLGMSGIGLYWCIIECLYENNGYLDLDQIDLLAYELRVDKNLIENLINNYDLFKKNKNKFYSKSVLKRLEEINKKSKTNKENVLKRWEKTKKQKELQTNYEKDTTVSNSKYYIKENKIKENKNKIKENIYISCSSYIEENYARAISSTEYEKIKSWCDDFDVELIKYAVDISILQNVKTFKYIQGILNNWKTAGYKTKQEVIEHENLQLKQNDHQEETLKLFDYNWLEDDDSTN